MTFVSQFGETIQPAACLGHLIDLLRGQDGSRADQGAVTKGRGQGRDAVQRIRRIQRNFDPVDACIQQNAANWFGLGRAQAAQNGNYRSAHVVCLVRFRACDNPASVVCVASAISQNAPCCFSAAA